MSPQAVITEEGSSAVEVIKSICNVKGGVQPELSSAESRRRKAIDRLGKAEKESWFIILMAC